MRSCCYSRFQIYTLNRFSFFTKKFQFRKKKIWFLKIIAAIEGCGGVPPIRPLETLHNALSLKQLDLFLEKMTAAPLYRTPTNTPPHLPSTPQPSSNPLGREYFENRIFEINSEKPTR